MPRILPSLLSADFTNLERDIRLMEEAGADALHLDVMDGHFVPNLTFGPPVIAAIRSRTRLMLDVHLMIANAEATFGDYIEAGADLLSVHFEAVTHLDRLLSEINRRGCRPGVVLNPHTPVRLLEEILPKCHHVLLMSVNPGFGGQEFISSSPGKVRRLKSLISSTASTVKIEIDGGVSEENAADLIGAGADWLVSGSSVFCSDDPVTTFRNLQQMAEQAAAVGEERYGVK